MSLMMSSNAQDESQPAAFDGRGAGADDRPAVEGGQRGQGDRPHRRGRRRGCERRLPARAVRRPVSVPERRPSPLRRSGADSRPDERGAGGRGPASTASWSSARSSSAARRAVPQHGRGVRRRRLAGRHVSQDAHPRRSAVLREVLFHARRSGLSQLSTRVTADRRLRLLGPVVSRGGPAHGADRRGDHLLSHGHRLAPR